MKTTRALVMMGAASMLFGAGCRRREASPETTPASRAPVAPPPATVGGSAAEAARSVLLDSVNLGRGVSAEGAVTSPGTVFRQGEPLFVSMQVAPISPGSELKLVWVGPGGRTNGQEQIVVPPGANLVNFRAKDTRTWEPGDHRIEVWMGGAKVGDKGFRIQGTATAANLPASR